MEHKIPKRRKVLLSLLIILIIITALIAPGLYNKLYIRHYTVESNKITNPIRIALITDLHSCKYGENQIQLIEAVESQNPDLIMMSGDIFDDQIPDINTEYFLKGIAEKYPCYYVTGNHEHWSGSEKFARKMEILEKYNVKILSGTVDTIEINNNTINICGVDDPANRSGIGFKAQLKQTDKLSQNGNYTILLSHRPEYFELYTDHNFDLVLSGHAHGGQWRIPGILNGLYAPDQGLFPEYAGGKYQREDTVMIVSRGLARESTSIPRIYNRPELVIIELEPVHI